MQRRLAFRNGPLTCGYLTYLVHLVTFRPKESSSCIVPPRSSITADFDNDPLTLSINVAS